ncbi:MAG: hypothetical protein A3B07_03270 [Candidatus Yonathbacteria bacterium RIFCSPLOWO2_01_FULL_43_27]|uniref:Uncharacterized protein n=2 Tax=Parcubacteria group TaxID=1794811 RepID=A0A1G2SDW6_9BACT|nr:MAG: hypothetical protein UW78_C0006G0073 [Candidatus Azambacteria bacterium GW2011_GWA1_44_9]OHA78806.1 MAG: hypothetical protein A2658_00225 [Candidatus Yonathbacteria bacterium RIFCSPHIGHO2_01_FULL_44_19]OHA82882.1 MAG: hypothetical protein A3B07_03270 [Candidatus Yonathbacteria bacterium RIFCSPLOWO2_01_FULL_43_27]
MSLSTPKYLTRETAEEAIDTALIMVAGESSPLKRCFNSLFPQCHITVLVPGMESHHLEDILKWPNFPIHAVSLCERSIGQSIWKHRYDEIAKCKALQLWADRNDDGTGSIPHLLFSEDTPYWGGVKRKGIVVACSGFHPWFDKMISGIIADIMIGLAHDAYENDSARVSDDFLS